MITPKHGIIALFSLSLSLGSSQPVQAQNDDLAKALIGALVIGGIAAGVANANQNAAAANNAAPRKQPKQSAAERAARQAEINAAMELQSSLNYFGFDAGPVDGAPGAQTRAAVATYQSTLGNPATGEITEFERSLLLEAKALAENNPTEAQRMVAASPYGIQGVPAVLRDYKLGIQPAAAPVVAETGELESGLTPDPEEPAEDLGMASFGTPTAPTRSINQHCTQVNALTTANGSLATASSMPDKTLALNEQFCLTRTAAMPEGKKAADSVAASQEQIDAQCGRLKTFVLSKAGDIGAGGPAAVLDQVRSAIAEQGQKPEETQLAGRICLGEGYRIDDAEMALASALALTASGQKPYAETVGHHLREGFGTTASAEAGKAWLTYALDAMAAGDAAVFLPGMAAERSAVLSAAIAAP